MYRHKADADQIERIAKEANDTSTKAFNLLKKALDGENKTSSDIDELNRKYDPYNSYYILLLLTYVFLLACLFHKVFKELDEKKR